MSIEVILLQGQRGVFPIEVEPRLAQGDDLRLLAQPNDFLPILRLSFRRVVGMNSGGGPYAIQPRRQLTATPARFGCRSNGQNAVDADGGGPLDYPIDIRRKLLVGQVS